ncbi:MAG: carbamoyltransferase C-terminal domain-containing protein, partial [Candidatus Hydrogenedentota bacterium]
RNKHIVKKDFSDVDILHIKVFNVLEGPFDDIWIQPSASDAGGALGAALFTWHQLLGNKRQTDNRRQKGSYLGPAFTDEAIEAYLEEERIHYQRMDEETLCDTVARLLERGKVVGWFQGRMEFGPRALGARSILGDARSPAMQSVMNRKIKFRESFRPFAPSVLAEHRSEYFDLDRESPYMLLVAPVHDGKLAALKDDEVGVRGFDKLRVVRSEIPAVTHVDNSARIQTVDKRDNPLYHKMLSRFYELTGCPVIINTSFNVRGEPIVCAPKDAYTCFMRTKMDYLALGPFLIDKAMQKEWALGDAWREDYPLD